MKKNLKRRKCQLGWVGIRFTFFQIKADLKTMLFAVKTKILSPESVKKVQNFSTGLITHVKNYYNSSLWPSLTPQAEKKNLPANSPSGDSTPIPATPILSPPVLVPPPADPPASEKSKPVSPIGIPSAPVLKDTSMPLFFFQNKLSFLLCLD